MAQQLANILDAQREHEVARRFEARFGSCYFRVSNPITEARKQAEEFTDALSKAFSESDLSHAKNHAVTSVEKLTENQRRREMFDGKLALERLFKIASTFYRNVVTYFCRSLC